MAPFKEPDIETLEAMLSCTYNWGYEETRAELRALYDKAARRQWVAEKVLDFSTDVDLEKAPLPERGNPLHDSDVYARMTPREKSRLNVEIQSWRISQFLHGEQGALLAAAQLVNAVPDFEAKLYSSSQVVDEGRHVAVFHRYLTQKIGSSYPVSATTKKLLDWILKDSRWDIKVIGMQIIIEGMALAAFSGLRRHGTEPLLRELLRYVMNDEARHVAFGILSLRDFYAQQNEQTRGEREDFLYEALAMLVADVPFDGVWDNIGLPAAECRAVTAGNAARVSFQRNLFSKVVPAVKRVGLLSDRQRERFEALGILKFEDAEDPFGDLEDPTLDEE